MTNIFEQASRTPLRFGTGQGPVSTEDLWNLPLQSKPGSTRTSLDDIAKILHKQLKESEETSFVTPTKTTDPVTQLCFDIVKHIIEAHGQTITVTSSEGKGTTFSFTLEKA